MKKIFTAIAAVAAAGMSLHAGTVNYAPQVSMKAPQVNDEIIWDQPEGELTWLDRTCDGFDTKGFEATHDIVRGSIVQRVDGEDGYVYLSHMASNYPVDTWTRFEKQGNTLVMEGVQAIYIEYDYDYDEELMVYLAPMEVVVDENDRGTFVVNDDCRYVFNIEEDGSLTAADPTMILGVCVQTLDETLEGNDIWIWRGFGDRDVKMTPQTSVPVEIPAGLELSDWVISDEYGQAFVQVGIDGEDFYVSGLDRSLPEAWVKGRISDGKVTFPSGQYLGADMAIYHYSYFCGAEFQDETDEEGETVRTCSYADYSVFDYDAENCLITSGPGKGYIINSTAKQLYPLYFYEDVTVGVQHRNPDAAPAAPYDVYCFYDEWDCSVWFQLPNTDVNGDILHTDRLYYEIYMDGELQYFDMADEDWNIERTSRVPYAYEDYDIYVEGTDHTVYLYPEEYPYSIGIRSVYVNENGEDIYSEMTFWGEPVSGVIGLGSDKNPARVKFYDLQGREIGWPATGVVVKVEEFSDGSAVRTKMIRK